MLHVFCDNLIYKSIKFLNPSDGISPNWNAYITYRMFNTEYNIDDMKYTIWGIFIKKVYADSTLVNITQKRFPLYF